MSGANFKFKKYRKVTSITTINVDDADFQTLWT